MFELELGNERKMISADMEDIFNDLDIDISDELAERYMEKTKALSHWSGKENMCIALLTSVAFRNMLSHLKNKEHEVPF